MITINDLPEPDCWAGHSSMQLESIMDEQQFRRLGVWLTGQTCVLCDGRWYDHDTKEYFECCEGVSHGPVIYQGDVIRFLTAAPIID